MHVCMYISCIYVCLVNLSPSGCMRRSLLELSLCAWSVCNNRHLSLHVGRWGPPLNPQGGPLNPFGGPPDPLAGGPQGSLGAPCMGV